MKRFLMLTVCILLCIGLIATLNNGQYVGLTGVLDKLQSIDFSFSDTVQVAIEMFDSFEGIGNADNLIESLNLLLKAVFDLIRIPFVSIQELVELLSNVFDLLFTLVGVF